MKKILVVSYYPPRGSGSMTLWTNDKVKSLVKLGYDVDLITSPIKGKIYDNNFRTFYVYSISPKKYYIEFKNVKDLRGLLPLPIVLTIGLFQELIERLLLRRIGDGMWGWTIPSFFKILLLNFRYKYDSILSLGGPTSSHLAVAINSYFSKNQKIIEFQDPIVGEDIGFNSNSALYFSLLERFLVARCSRVIFVTRTSAQECQSRFPSAENISFIYTSSQHLISSNGINKVEPKSDFNLTIAYFGEIYSTRNYDSLLAALKQINENDLDMKILLAHYGGNPNLNLNELQSIKVHFDLRDTVSRDNAMNEALAYNLLLLIQHTDNRSKLTIPYKTWDYLNLQKPILALINNDELKMLLDGLGHYTCDVNDVDSIANAILRFVKDHRENKIKILPNPYNIDEQVLELLS
jgi:glycosyltransferase involved in cell wall biosynthesis